MSENPKENPKLLPPGALRKLCKSFLEHSSLVFTNEHTCYTDGKGTIFYPHPPSYCTPLQRDEYIMKLWHEYQHNVPEKNGWRAVMEEMNGKEPSWKRLAYNIVCDMMNDYVNHDDFVGVHEAYENYVPHFLQEIEEKDKENTIENDFDRGMITLFKIRAYAFQEWLISTKHIDVRNTFLESSDPKITAWFDQILSESLPHKINRTTDCRELKKILDDICDRIFKLKFPPEEQEPEAETQAAASKVKYEDWVENQHEETEQHKTYVPLEIDYSGYSHDGTFWKGYPIVEMVPEGNPDKHYQNEIIRIYKSISHNLPKKVRQLLLTYSQTHWNFSKKNGYLDNPRLYRVGTYKEGGESWRKVFKKPRPKLETKESRVFLLIDCSGSMGGDKYPHAAVAASMLKEAIEGLGVSVIIAGFTQRYDDNTNYWFQQPNERISIDKLIDRFSAIPDMGSNSDGDSIMFAYETLMKCNEDNKILIVLSDGQPAAGCLDGDMRAPTYTHKVTEFIQRGNDVKLYGIGIQSDSVNHYYKNRIVIDDPSQLESKLLEVVRDQLLETF